MEITDPYVAYCFDEACAFIAEMMDRKRMPKFTRPDAEKQRLKATCWTTNADVIEEILKETKQ